MVETRFGALKGLRQQPSEQAQQEEFRIVPEMAPDEIMFALRRGPGRPGGGKRSNPDYERLNLLIRKATRLKVDMKLLQEPEQAKDLSELVDRLLAQWAE